MAKIAVASMFRDSEFWCGRHILQVERFFQQVERECSTRSLIPNYYLVEGNSRDDTWDKLRQYSDIYQDRVNLFKHDVVGSDVASIVSETRFRNLSVTANVAFRAARDSGAEYVLWVESDFILRPETHVLHKLMNFTYSWAWGMALGIVPVPVFGNMFYDTWAFEGLNGEKWSNNDLDKLLKLGTYVPLKSAGSCMLMNGDNLRQYNLDFGTGCFPSLCRQAREHKLTIDCDTTCLIYHPSEYYLNGRLI